MPLSTVIPGGGSVLGYRLRFGLWRLTSGLNHPVGTFQSFPRPSSNVVFPGQRQYRVHAPVLVHNGSKYSGRMPNSKTRFKVPLASGQLPSFKLPAN